MFQRWAGPWLDKAGDDEQNGHDFWLTRRRHGAGFWDRGYGDSVGEILTKIAQMFPEELCITVDGANHLVEIE